VAETLLQFPRPISTSGGQRYEARACGAPMDSGGLWQGWIEFIPVDGGEPLRSPRETTQPNRTDTEYWATGLTDVYLEGALRRAIDGPPVIPVVPPPPSVFSTPVPSTPIAAAPGSVLDPFSVYEKGEALLRRQLGALSAWHLVNIARDYELTGLDAETLNRLPAIDLVDLIVQGVQRDIDRRHSA
jgi:hypothetical protein